MGDWLFRQALVQGACLNKAILCGWRTFMKQVEIRVKGHLDQSWSDWFEGLMITHTEQGETVLTGSVVDQAALYGLLAKLRDLGLSLLTVHSEEMADLGTGPADQNSWPGLDPSEGQSQ